jgi:hypothetical protein
MVISFGKVIGVMIIATALTVFKSNFSKKMLQKYIYKTYTHKSLLKMLSVTLHFLVLLSSCTVLVMRTAFDTWNDVNKLSKGSVDFLKSEFKSTRFFFQRELCDIGVIFPRIKYLHFTDR